METPATTFTIPTYRLPDVPETVERYHENFWLNGHEVALIVYAQLEATRNPGPLASSARAET